MEVRQDGRSRSLAVVAAAVATAAAAEDHPALGQVLRVPPHCHVGQVEIFGWLQATPNSHMHRDFGGRLADERNEVSFEVQLLPLNQIRLAAKRGTP